MEQLAKFFRVNPNTIYKWKLRHVEFADAIKATTEWADNTVARYSGGSD